MRSARNLLARSLIVLLLLSLSSSLHDVCASITTRAPVATRYLFTCPPHSLLSPDSNWQLSPAAIYCALGMHIAGHQRSARPTTSSATAAPSARPAPSARRLRPRAETQDSWWRAINCAPYPSRVSLLDRGSVAASHSRT